MQKDEAHPIDPRFLRPPEHNLPPPPVPVRSRPSERKDAAEHLTNLSNADFIAAVFSDLPEGARAAVCSKKGDPTEGGWFAMKADAPDALLPPDNNNYVSCSSFQEGEDGAFRVRKSEFVACHFLMLDDLGTKIPLEKLGTFQPSWLIETSPGNFQAGIIFTIPLTDGDEADQISKALIAAGLCDAGASGPQSRWARLPVAINGKEKYRDAAGEPFHCRLTQWCPEKRYTPHEIVQRLQLDLSSQSNRGHSERPRSTPLDRDAVLTPRAEENPVIATLRNRGLYKSPLGSGKHDVTCPWVHEHTDALDTGAAYFEPDDDFPVGGFCCQHSHRDRFHIREVLDFLGIQDIQARHKPVIRVVAGDLHRVVDAAERELAKQGRHYQSGGLIASVSTDPATGDPAIVPTSLQSLTRELCSAAVWEKLEQRSQKWVRCDPPHRHVANLYETQAFRHLPVLSGLARQPFIRECDGELIVKPGYDRASGMFGVFDPRQFNIADPTPEAARLALATLEDLLDEFPFASPADRAAALSAMCTAVVRSSIPFAPAFHVRAPVFGSGKTYLCNVIGAFAGPAPNVKVSYPKTSEEATKVILSLLLPGPAVVEFDDMESDWLPHGVINRMLTAEQITERILGVSKTATVRTRTLFLGSGNNVGPVRDLLRRVVTIHLDPRCATPATRIYKKSPIEKVRGQRGLYVSAVLTIIQAWRKAGSPRAAVEGIATYNGPWADYCRHPLIWLGHPDPATSLLGQIKHDPDAEALGRLLAEWWRLFGSTPTTIRRLLEVTACDEELHDALREFPVEERGSINRSKLGWILKKNANRIIGDLQFERAEADGRTAWRVTRTVEQ